MSSTPMILVALVGLTLLLVLGTILSLMRGKKEMKKPVMRKFALAPPTLALLALFGATAATPPSWLVPEWDWDPSNASGHASDRNPCTSTALPCLTYAQIASRWGTLEPVFPQNTLLRQMSPQTGTSAPVVVRAHTSGSARFTYLGVPSTVTATTISGLSPKTRGTPGAPGHPLQIILPAGAAPGNLVVDATAGGSTAFIDRVVGGTAWMDQPLSAPTTAPASFGLRRTENNAWADGDSITAFALPTVDMVEWSPSNFDYPGSGNNYPILQDVQLLDTGNSISPCIVKNYSSWQDVSTLRALGMVTQNPEGFLFNGVDDAAAVTNIANTSQQSSGTVYFIGGDMRGNFMNFTADGLIVGADTIVGSGSNGILEQNGGGYGVTGVSTTDGVYLDTGARWSAGGPGAYHTAAAGNTPIYGPGTLDVGNGASFSFSSSAVNEFLQSTLLLSGSTTACSVGTGSSAAWNCGIALTPANLDAAVGVAGFGGIAISNSTGSRIQNQTGF